ncbi:bromodomain-containing protein 8-like [Lagopus leucura]|uniref:bromodomain-containing protein 8-like n=1 Tax=Lagopus leucura TaxID=30410 RepID=UPI001C673192|nr:bromodomain-containing protein 8-like [Lagopus leucura]
MGHPWVWCSSESESEDSDLQSLLSWHSSLDLEVGNWRDSEEVAIGKPEESSQETDSRLEFSDPLWEEDDSEDFQKAERQYEDDSLLQFFSEITQLLEPLRVSCTDSAETQWDCSGSGKQDDGGDLRCQEETTRTVVSRAEESQPHVLAEDEKEHFSGREDKTQEAPGEKTLCEPDSQEINQAQDQDDSNCTSADPMLGSTSPANPQLMQLSWDNPMQHSHFKRTVLSIWKMIASHRCSGPFLKAVSDKQAPGYSEVVKRPMDLTSIKRGLAKGHIRSLAQFQCSLMLMFQNAIMYNAANHHVHRMALEMRREVLEQMQMLGEALLRSEHRR